MQTVVEMEQEKSFWVFKGAIDYVDKWFLMGSPFTMLLILVSYLAFVLKYGPMMMKDRPAFKLRRVLMAYNAFQVFYSIYIVYLGVGGILDMGLGRGCPLDNDTFKYRITSGHYMYVLAKLSELLDTVFFVLRKKWSQVSFLHVYHHSLMFSAAWTCLKYEPTHSMIFLGTVNSFVHVIMYAYYGLSAFPRLQQYLWWKKYITKMQLIQFLIIIIQVTWNFKVTKCAPSFIILILSWVHAFLFTYLFVDFYIKSYTSKKQESVDIKDNVSVMKEKPKFSNLEQDGRERLIDNDR